MSDTLTTISYFTVTSLFFSNLIMKYADLIIITFLEIFLSPIGYFVEFSNDDNEKRNFIYINNFITNNAYCLRRKPKFVNDNEIYLYDDLKLDNKEQYHNHIYNGPFFIKFENKYLLGFYKEESGQHIGFSQEIYKKYSIKLFITNQSLCQRLVNFSLEKYNEKCLSVGLRYKYSVGNPRWAYWKDGSFNVPKTNDFCRNGTMIEFEEKIKEFINSKQDYYDMNIPYKKTFLLYGKPGTGKSRFTKSIARTYNIPIHELFIGAGYVSDVALKLLLAGMQPGIKMLLVDEFDSIKTDKKNKTSQEVKMEGVSNAIEPSKSGWNNLLDAEANNGLIVVCITNLNLSQLRELYGDAFLREGRFDYKYEFKFADKDMIEQYFSKHNLNISEEVINFLHGKVGMAHFQSIFVKNYKSVRDIEDKINELYLKLKNKDDYTFIEFNETSEVSQLLNKNNLKDYIHIFNGRKIKSLDQFKLLSENNLKDDLGIPLGDRLLINSLINNLKEEVKK